MTSIFDSDDLPPDLQLAGTSFYSRQGTAWNVRNGEKNGYQFVVFIWKVWEATILRDYSIVAIRTQTPIDPGTSLSWSSGLQLERVGDWVFVSEEGRPRDLDQLDVLVDDAFNLIGYANGFAQNS